MSYNEMKNIIKRAKVTALFRELLRQGIIDKEIFIKADKLNALSCK